MATKEFLDLDGLREYNGLIKDNYVAKQEVPYDGTFVYATTDYIDYNDKTYPLVQVSSSPSPYTIPVRSADGSIKVGTPYNNSDAATKKYVDDAIDEVESTINTTIDEVESAINATIDEIDVAVNKKAGLKTLGMTYTDASGTTRTCGDGEVFNMYGENITIGEDGYPLQGNIASGSQSHAEGYQTLASGSQSHAEGHSTIASGSGSHAEGLATTASGADSHAEGYNTKADGYCAHAEGYSTKADGSYSHAEGNITTANGNCSHAEGYHTTALEYQHAQGHYNSTTNAAAGIQSGTSTDTKCTAFVIGNGTSSSASNAFRISYAGKPYAKSTLTTTGCDYAEYFEWKDLNLNSEDRRGYFVTLDGEQIKIAEPNDYILGIISGQPSIVGNGDEDWLGRYIFDEFGAFVYEDFEYEVEVPEEIQEEVINEETGKSTIVTKTIMKTVTKTGTKYKENPNYDPTIPYIHREDRPEWDAVGMLGVLSVRDDGTCEVNGYCKVAEGGIATASETGYRVIKRVNDNIVKVIFR